MIHTGDIWYLCYWNIIGQKRTNLFMQKMYLIKNNKLNETKLIIESNNWSHWRPWLTQITLIKCFSENPTICTWKCLVLVHNSLFMCMAVVSTVLLNFMNIKCY